MRIFTDILEDEVVRYVAPLLKVDDTWSTPKLTDSFYTALYKHTDNWTEYLISRLNASTGFEAILKNPTSKYIMTAALADLKELTNLNNVKGEYLRMDFDFVKYFKHYLGTIPEEGYGIYRDFHFFSFNGDSLIPATSVDPTSLKDLIGYDDERAKVIANTECFVGLKSGAGPSTGSGVGATQPEIATATPRNDENGTVPSVGVKGNNVLLYGDAGTGKSTTVRALIHEYADKGLRLIEIPKSNIVDLPKVYELIRNIPLKFIIFVDDLSFESDDDSFITVKNILEGSIATYAPNTLIYATSNRRHFINEKFSNRQGDDVFINDTLEELNSLSKRFGLRVTFQKPNKELYLKIVHSLLQDNLPQGKTATSSLELDRAAEEFALRSGGRSPRTALQFVKSRG
jgi:predicted AAA+ superfamily ATPase